ncbi:MAG: SpoIIE family protein phosphatase [Bacteroidales bacterium]|nr:SpoIIE family protein phosphatase [Bacteroidales bacterium]
MKFLLPMIMVSLVSLSAMAHDGAAICVGNIASVESVGNVHEVALELAETLHWAYGIVVVVLVIIIALIALIFLFNRQSNKLLMAKEALLNGKEADIQSLRSEIQSLRDEIKSQKEVITRQQKKADRITKDINYARRIQFAAVSKQSEVDQLFPDNFIFYRPRDIVSGDFYRVATCGKYSVVITADCTGHGIPGAFLSMLGISALNEFCVTEEDAANPGTILDRMRNFVKDTLISSDSDETIYDGMDMTICCYDFDAMEMRCASANQTGFIVRGGNLITFRGDRMPVGRNVIEKEHFESITIPLEKGDMVYTFSDGITDQLGGKDGRKINANRLTEVLIKIADQPTAVQCKMLADFVDDWRGDLIQLDDMTLIGIRV